MGHGKTLARFGAQRRADSGNLPVLNLACDPCIARHQDVSMGAVSLRLPEPIAQRLQALSERTGRSKTYYMIEAIEEHLEDLEDLYYAEQQLAAIRAGAPTVSLDEAERLLGLEA
jgi:RHH-type rel operon transcriptional repressor/antitoxin RelB